MDRREFENKFPAYDGKPLIGDDGKLLEELQRPVLKAVNKLQDKLYRDLEDDGNHSVYTGAAGIALLHLHLHNVSPQGSDHLQRALRLIERPLRHLKGKRLSFLCGDAGPLAIGAVLHHQLGNTRAVEDCVKQLESLHGAVCSDASLPDELLYGRAGYLYSLLFVQKHIDAARINKSIITKVYKAIIDSGTAMSKQERCKHPLMYAWHDKHYLGAAHGLAGIFYTMMQVDDPSLEGFRNELIKPSIDYMLTLRFASGNCPSSIGSSTGDKLIHWCHGAPGWVHMFIAAYKIFGDAKYLAAAQDCAEVIWQRGILKKGYGICHGTAGNGYAFLAMFQLTQDPKYLYWAYKFAEWCLDYGKHGCRIPDTPLSLFEGLAGTIYFLTDILDPINARFPAFALT